MHPSKHTEEIFALLVDDGIKNQNHNVVLERAGICLDHIDEKQDTDIIGIFVDIHVAREKDLKLPHRAQLCEEVRDIVETEMQTLFPSKPEAATPSMLLCVRVVLLSDGSSAGPHREDHGRAKLTLAYCLQDISSGKVGMANQLYATEDCSQVTDNYWEYSSAVVRSLARRLSHDIADEVTAGIQEWKSQAGATKERLNQIQVKLANEEFLDTEEYIFAAEHHALG